jgi:hypothetical protein
MTACHVKAILLHDDHRELKANFHAFWYAASGGFTLQGIDVYDGWNAKRLEQTYLHH